MTPQTELLELLPVAVCTTDAAGRLTFYNEAAAALWGRRPELGTAWCGSWKLFHTDGRPMPHSECPLALALEEGRPVRDMEAVLERPDGVRVLFLPHPTPLRDTSGRVTGAINMLVDLSDRESAHANSALLASIVASSEDAIVSKTITGRITSWNAGAERIFGYRADEMIGQHITTIIPPERHGEEERIIAKLRRGERVESFDTVRRAKDGRLVDVSATISPLRNAFGEVVGASKVARDITGRKQAERSQRLLVDELNHRVKNTLATVQAIASLSARRAADLAEFVPGFTGRIQALAKAHTLLAQSRMEGADIAGLVREQVCLGDTSDTRISAVGPHLMIDAQAAVHLSMVLHELATNARRHGALSVPEGRLSVEWAVTAGAGRVLSLHWREKGASNVRAPRGKGGFGTMLIEQTLRGHGGRAAMTYGADGIVCEIVLPLPETPPPLEASLQTAPRRQAPEVVAGASAPARRLDGKRILIIEDEPLISLDLEFMLGAAGCEIAGSAGTIDQAMALVDGVDCDAAVLDGNIGGDPVDEVARALTARGTPFVFVTGYGRESLPQGFRDGLIVAKPFTAEQLVAAVEAILAGQGIVRLRRQTG
ncbi:MAG TPA: PAS domain S-box protein [Geminicoccaceae bacterium]|nr:PAS domain S-box protein [Geminicoccus sp.]HMU49693.1 PAS domain S-box protein [Geminicoccaceae bacterium]